jgi:hypothetical protein
MNSEPGAVAPMVKHTRRRCKACIQKPSTSSERLGPLAALLQLFNTRHSPSRLIPYRIVPGHAGLARNPGFEKIVILWRLRNSEDMRTILPAFDDISGPIANDSPLRTCHEIAVFPDLDELLVQEINRAAAAQAPSCRCVRRVRRT